MNYFVSRAKLYLKSHFVAVIIAVFIALIYGLPNVWFMVSIGDNYQGIPMMAVANEDFYVSRMHEILDGHPMVASHIFFEYKDQYALAPPVGEFFYVIPAIIFGTSIINILIVSKFILPALLFLLVYIFIYQLSNGNFLWQKKLSALAGSLFVVLGYDLIDYRSLSKLITGAVEPEGWLLWSRPVNPILGAIFLFLFLNSLYLVIKNKNVKKSIVASSIFLSIMIASYFFSWGVAMSVFFIIGLFYLFQKKYNTIKNFIIIILLTLVLTAPYWYITMQSHQSELYNEAILHSGLFLTHYPLFNKVLIASSLFFSLVILYCYIYQKDLWTKMIKKNSSLVGFQNWVIVSFSLIIGSFMALNQQIITGMTVWPFHFVQYTIPLAIIAVSVIFHNIILKKSKLIWAIWVVLIIFSSSLFGIYTQIKSYQNNYDNYYNLQKYQNIFSWFNQQSPDCVVMMSTGDRILTHEPGILITAFTHCNVYANNAVFSTIMPMERRFHNYFTILRFKGVKAEDIDNYIVENKNEIRWYLFSNWKGLYDISFFSDFKDELLVERTQQIPEKYKEFLKLDLTEALSKYRLDYILSEDELDESLLNDLSNVELVYQDGLVFIYRFNK